MNLLDSLRDTFQTSVQLRERRPGVSQIIAPLFHEDGDMVDVYLDLPPDAIPAETQTIRIRDHGMTLLRLSYTFEIDTPNKDKIFRRILAENGIQEEAGELFLDIPAPKLGIGLLQFGQAVAKVANLRYFKREVLESLFDEMLAEFIRAKLSRFRPEPGIFPIPERDDLEVDWSFRPNGIPIYLFGVKDANRARLATISCLEFQRNGLGFKSMAVHEDFEKISRKDMKRLTSAADKQFTSLKDFQDQAEAYLEREARHN